MRHEIGLVDRHINTHDFSEHPGVLGRMDTGDLARDVKLKSRQTGGNEVDFISSCDRGEDIRLPNPCAFEHVWVRAIATDHLASGEGALQSWHLVCAFFDQLHVMASL